MNSMSFCKILRGISWLAIVVLGAAGCRNADQSVTPSADPVAKVPGFIRLDKSQQERLGIELSPVRLETIRAMMPSVGWFVATPASETIIRAPVAGFAMVKPRQAWPTLGQEVSAGQALVQLNVFLSPQEVSQLVQAKEDNDILLQQSLVTMELTGAQLKLVSDAREAVAGVRIDQLKEAYQRSKVAYKEAQDKVPFLIQEPYENGVLVKPVSIEAPKAGRILQMHVAAGQFVQAGDSLWTVADWSTLWLRVPIFAGDVQRIEPLQAAVIRDRRSGTVTTATAMTLPTEMKPGARTVDCYYAVTNPEWRWRVGQSTAVELPIADEERVLLIPRSAVLYDGFGQAFCFASEADRTQFQRRRIELGARYQDRVAVLRGLDDDDSVVSVGAEQLAAEESKADLAVKDND